jgi:predicted nucleic acid-binding protein
VSWLLDADILSQPAKRHGDARVIAWLEQEKPRCYTSAVVIAQLALWVRSKEGRQRQALQAWLPLADTTSPSSPATTNTFAGPD